MHCSERQLVVECLDHCFKLHLQRAAAAAAAVLSMQRSVLSHPETLEQKRLKQSQIVSTIFGKE